jgi:predicted GNAT family N-acyltransferase
MATLIYKTVTTVDDLQKAFFVRGIVFEEEQGCAYTDDFDGRDFSAVHFLATLDDEPVATARLRFLNGYVKIERLAVRKNERGKGTGKKLFAFAIDYVKELGYSRIVIHAQAYLLKFYEGFGFVAQGEKFTEANIEHYHMEKHLQ